MNKNAFAPTPPMGWNSWDCYGASVTEKRVKAKYRLHGRTLERPWMGIYCLRYSVV